MQSALEQAIEQAKQASAGRIHVIRLRVGALSGVVPEALEFAFDCVARNTMAAGARLEVERVPPLCYCGACKREFEPEGLLYECPHCHDLSAEVRRGRELELASLEVS
jgi:hydrogenase nickel incorporation protein HypA/HybF